MFYKVDFSKLVVYLLPPVLRSKFLLSLLWVMIEPIRYLYNRFIVLKDGVDSCLSIGCNVQYIEKIINDTFFLKNRQIYIDTPEERKRGAYIYMRNELNDLKIYMKGEGVNLFLVNTDEYPVPVNFIVNVPTFLCTSTDDSCDRYHGVNKKIIEEILNQYKPAGRTSSIELYDYE